MTEKNIRSKSQREQKKKARLSRLSGIDLCACAGGHKLRCEGPCRASHTPSGSSVVECDECYRIERDMVTNKDQKRKKTWRYGRQRDEEDSQQVKQARRKKIDRDRN